MAVGPHLLLKQVDIQPPGVIPHAGLECVLFRSSVGEHENAVTSFEKYIENEKINDLFNTILIKKIYSKN